MYVNRSDISCGVGQVCDLYAFSRHSDQFLRRLFVTVDRLQETEDKLEEAGRLLRDLDLPDDPDSPEDGDGHWVYMGTPHIKAVCAFLADQPSASADDGGPYFGLHHPGCTDSECHPDCTVSDQPTALQSDAAKGCDQPSDALTGVEFLLVWMGAKNPQLGGLSPLELIDMGRADKLATFIRSCTLENEAAP